MARQAMTEPDLQLANASGSSDHDPLRKEHLEEKELTDRIRACVFAVSNALGPGSLEQIYGHALLIELHSARAQIKRFVL